MTEEEAKTKWCPHVRFMDLNREDDTACNRHGDGDLDNPERGNNPKYARCIGSACMAWREETSGPKVGHGYCGLAGKP